MALGLTEKLTILDRSPHDALPQPLALSDATEFESWVPSRYNIRAQAEDGRLVLWNTLRGSMVVFKAKDRAKILELLKPKGVESAKTGTVGYLARQGFLVRRGANEYRQFQRLFGQQHNRSDNLELILLASEDCNFRCEYCYEDFARGTMIPEVREGIKNLLLSRIKKLNHFSVNWFGGEPLYGWEAIEELAPFFLRTTAEHKVSFQSYMTTNGYLLTPEISQQLLEWKIRRFQITLDGLAEDHDRNRPTRDGAPTFDRIVNNLEALARHSEPFQVRLRVNFDAVNSPRLKGLVEYLADRFADDRRFQIAFHAVGKWGGPNDDQLEVCSEKDAAQVQRELRAAARARGFTLPTLKESSLPGSQVCYAARPFNLLIGATGKVMKCTIALDKDPKNVVGHLAPDGKLTLDSDRMALWTEPAFEQDAQCRKCVILPTCQGVHCPLIRIDDNTQPCTTTRLGAKGQLLDTLRRTPGRSVRVRAEA